MSENPLSEAQPLSLDKFFSADPRTLTDNEIAIMCQALREHRTRLVAAEQAGKSVRSVAVKAPKAKTEKVKLDLSDLTF